ncbi:MAG: shikimate dehydrogenase [Hungatella sp.]
MISGTTKICGVMADPVEHSLSPLMQNFYAEKTGVDFAYMPLKVAVEDVEAAVLGAYALNFVCMNVTVQHKQQEMPYLKEIDEDAKAIGAVNTLVRMEGGYKGYNTDAAGLLRAMREAKIQLAGEDCILIGAGGAAKAAAYVLAKEGAQTVTLLNRHVGHAMVLAEEINHRFGRPVMTVLALSEYALLPKKSYLAIQSTSVGMYPHSDHAPIEDPDFYRMIHTGVDIVYNPMETKFMQYVSAAGGRVMNGFTMLLYQGIAAFELWNPGVKISPQIVEEAGMQMRSRLKG